ATPPQAQEASSPSPHDPGDAPDASVVPSCQTIAERPLESRIVALPPQGVQLAQDVFWTTFRPGNHAQVERAVKRGAPFQGPGDAERDHRPAAFLASAAIVRARGILVTDP